MDVSRPAAALPPADTLPEMNEDLSAADLAAIETSTQKIGRHLFENLAEDHSTPLARRWWDDRLMAWTMQDEALKVQLFRFVDVLPMLDDSETITRHLSEYLDEVRDHLPAAIRVALGVARRTPLVRGAVAKAARVSAMDFARRFIAGTNAREVLQAARRERDLGRGFTLDILGEAVTSDVEAEAYFRAYMDLLTRIAPTVNAWPEVSAIDRSPQGPVPRVNLSVKLSALDSQFDAVDRDGTTDRVAARLRELLRIARQLWAFIHIDMESYDKKNLTLHIFRTVLAEKEFRDVTDVGIVIQCYLRDAAADLQCLRDWARQRGAPVWVRLVKGAYWDYETTHARANGWPVPVYQKKWQSDAEFERQTRFLMIHRELLRPALGSHNMRSLAHGIAVARHLEVPPASFEIQMLYGMADAEKQALVDLGHRLRIYMPYGELIPGMAYLVRRLLENTSNDSFLRASFAERIDPGELLKPPGTSAARRAAPVQSQEPVMSAATTEFAPLFQNEPPVDFAREENRRAMSEALAAVKQELGGVYPLVIGDELVDDTPERLDSVDPSRKDRVVARVPLATAEHAAAAIAAAQGALAKWAARPVEDRAEFLRQAAQVMRRRKFELAAWEVYECGKTWREATADVGEAIDFCEYYAACAVALQGAQGVDVPGEENRFEYLPRGVTAVISPWNFPLAILTGMTVAALTTGNTVVMKPAEQAPLMASLLTEIFRELGLPAGVLNYLPGRGEVVGAALVEHPDVALIAFTGSRSVGLAINFRAAEVSARGGRLVKRVIAEMGGKNAILVDDDADLDEAVLAVVKSAFGFQGQKCSACSRAVVLDSVYEAFLKRLIEASRSLKVGPAEDPATSVGPVIDEEAWNKVREYIEIGRREGREVLAVDVGPLAQTGYFIGPHIFADVPPDSRIAREEIFGPVLAVIRAADLDEALAIANGTDYALTGGFFSRSPANLDRVRRELLVGNLYLNRGITGALVGRQPFGGFKMSGIGSKAGGPDYLLQFVLPRTITENTMRRGFAPPPGE